MLRALDQPAYLLSVAFVGLKEIRRLNRSYRGRDYPTDVLSFSYGREQMEGLPFLGEIVIAPEVAYRQAMASRTDPEREMRMLLLHGLLHLLGYDHETDRGEMLHLQRRLMRRRWFREPAPLTDMGSRP